MTAQYSIREDGGLKVTNSGYSEKKKEWKMAEGRAYFFDDKSKGHLKSLFLAHSIVLM